MTTHVMNRIQSNDHNIESYRVNKITLSPDSDFIKFS